MPIVLATFPLTAGYPDGQLIFDVVFFVVIISVLVQGFTLEPLVTRLGLGAEPPSLATVAEALPLDAPGAEALEIEVGSSARIVGRELREVPPPHEARVAVVLRGAEVVVATGSTAVAAGDRLVVFAPDPSRPAGRPRRLGRRPGQCDRRPGLSASAPAEGVEDEREHERLVPPRVVAAARALVAGAHLGLEEDGSAARGGRPELVAPTSPAPSTRRGDR